jgi:hypothetical protein
VALRGWPGLLRSTAVLFCSVVHVSVSRGNSSLLKEHTVSMNLVSSDVKSLPYMIKFYLWRRDRTGGKKDFLMWNSKNFCKAGFMKWSLFSRFGGVATSSLWQGVRVLLGTLLLSPRVTVLWWLQACPYWGAVRTSITVIAFYDTVPHNSTRWHCCCAAVSGWRLQISVRMMTPLWSCKTVMTHISTLTA